MIMAAALRRARPAPYLTLKYASIKRGTAPNLKVSQFGIEILSDRLTVIGCCVESRRVVQGIQIPYSQLQINQRKASKTVTHFARVDYLGVSEGQRIDR
jgi:hypothetical protein